MMKLIRHITLLAFVTCMSSCGTVVNSSNPYSEVHLEQRDFVVSFEMRKLEGGDSDVIMRGLSFNQLMIDSGLATELNSREWNKYKIQLIGAHLTLWVNEEKKSTNSNLVNDLPAKGNISAHSFGSELEIRDFESRVIKDQEANEILAIKAGTGYQQIFNGLTFDGWAGPTDEYEIVDGAIRCRKGHGGTIFTNEIYEDFDVRFEFKLPPGGNNGLAIRYPGAGDTAYVGMCELQVLDNSSPMYANLKPYQFHGSAYGMVAAKRGYQRPVGEWNYQEVRVHGSTIQVDLNGTNILACDLSKIDTPLSGRDHPGRGRTAGSFGFAGHGDPVEFRRIFIRPAPKLN